MKEKLMLVAAMTLAGSSVVVGKMLTEQLPVFFTTFCSLLVALVCMLPLMRNRWQELRRLRPAQYGNLFLQGLCGIVLFRVFILYGLRSTGAVEAGIITGTTPAVLAVLSWLMLGERFSRRGGAGILCAAAGCILVNLAVASGNGRGSIVGSLLVGAAVCCEALFTIFRKRISESVSATTNTTVLLFCSLLLVFSPAIHESLQMNGMPGRGATLAILYYGMFATVLAYLLWTSAVVRVNGAVAGAATAAMPASSLLLGALVLGEPITWPHLAGCLLIMTGIMITSGKPSSSTA